MTSNLYWIQCGGCGGDTMSILNAHSPNIPEAMQTADVNMLWHPSFSTLSRTRHRQLLDDLLSGALKLDILCVEGAIIQGPENSGLYDTFEGKPKKDLISVLAGTADHVLGIGTCASFGGITAAGETDAVGLQFSGKKPGGLLGKEFRTATGQKVINIPGCPAHPSCFTGTVSMILSGQKIELNEYQSLTEYYGMLVHQGCTRNEYHEYQVEETDFGQKGCLFFHMGCHGPSGPRPMQQILMEHQKL